MELPAKSIALIGMMGAGKSSVGRCLERRTGLVRIDVDEAVSAKFGRTIVEIFGEFGEQGFRDAETAVLREVNPTRAAIVVTGGGIVLRPENVVLLKKLGLVVWLEADIDTLFRRASRRGNRPLLQTEDPRQKMESLLQARTSLYRDAADLRVDTTNRSHDEVADTILEEVERRTLLTR